MRTVLFFLEEPSAEEMLRGILPRILPEGVTPRYVVFRGKQDLEKQLIKRLRGWQQPDTTFVIMRDQDSGDCKIIKEKLTNLCAKAGKSTVLVRIACRELESFYLGDLAAVEKGLNMKGITKKQLSRKFRSPDNLANPSEELEKLTEGRYQKKAGSRAIAPFLLNGENRSHSFNILVSGIKKAVECKQHG